MKKILSVIMVIALLAMSAVALADGNAQRGIPGGMPPQGQTGGPMMGGPNGGNRPDWQMPNGQTPSGENPSGAPELPSGEKPADLPELPNGEKPADAPELPSGEKPADLPELPNGEKPSGAPELPNGEKPVMIDFDAMVTKGVISQETCDKIKAYMAEHLPAGMPGMNGQTPNGEKPEGMPEMNGEQPVDGQTPPELPDGEKPEGMPGMNSQAPEAPTMNGLLKELLDAEVITQAEYDALSAAQATDAD